MENSYTPTIEDHDYKVTRLDENHILTGSHRDLDKYQFSFDFTRSGSPTQEGRGSQCEPRKSGAENKKKSKL